MLIRTLETDMQSKCPHDQESGEGNGGQGGIGRPYSRVALYIYIYSVYGEGRV